MRPAGKKEIPGLSKNKFGGNVRIGAGVKVTKKRAKSKKFYSIFSKNRGSGEGRALSQVITFRTSEADHSFATDNEACAAPKKYSKKTFSTNDNGVPAGETTGTPFFTSSKLSCHTPP